jgi:AcrR family transcriptional regulator
MYHYTGVTASVLQDGMVRSRSVPADRPRRGAPADTRRRLVAAAARVFNRDGFHGTDTNRIARAAGYAPGSFYKHFADKRAIFLEAWDAWVTAEWAAVETALAAGGDVRTVAARIVDLVLSLHRRWRGFRASMRSLVGTDAVARRFHRRQRVRQLRLLRDLDARAGRPPRPAEDDALLLFTLERVCDAAADGELRDLGLSTRAMVERLEGLVRARLADVRPASARRARHA